MHGVIITIEDMVIPTKILSSEKMTSTKIESLKNLIVNATVPILFSSWIADGTYEITEKNN